jgi:BirA family biotin operon repressor/biotin-[acetyl-CoA-carboxylase] ligase
VEEALKEKETTAFKQLDVKALQQQLNTRFFGVGNRLVFFSTVDSTNTLAMQLAQGGAEEGTVVITDSQMAGKGRLGRRWVDRPGCYALSSTILRPHFPSYLLVMVASLAVVDAIADTCGLTATIKWPNDVLVGEGKVAGILIETSHDRAGCMVAIMGIGVNVNGQIAEFVKDHAEPSSVDQGLVAPATTLEAKCGHQVSRETFIAHLLEHIETSYLALQQSSSQDPAIKASGSASRLMRERWRNQLSTLGRTIQVRQGETTLSGVAEDVDDHGELLLRCHSGERVTITWGDIGYPDR